MKYTTTTTTTSYFSYLSRVVETVLAVGDGVNIQQNPDAVPDKT